MARDDDMAYLRSAVLRYLDGARPSTTRIWVNLVAPVVIQAAAGAGHWAAGRRQRALAEWAGAAGFGLAAWGLGTEAGDRGRGARGLPAAAKGPGAQARYQGPGYHQAGDSRGPPDRAVLPLVRPCFPGSVGGHQRAVAPAPPAAADGARDRLRSPGRRAWHAAGGPGRAAAQAADGRRLSPDRSRIGSPAAGSIG